VSGTPPGGPPPDARPPALAPTAERRDLVAQRLSTAFASGRIELEDLERRLEITMRATTNDQLESALAGLEKTKPAVEADEEPARVPAPPFGADRPKASRRTVAILSGNIRRGRWLPAQVHTVWAVLGGAKLDLREAELPAGVTQIQVNAVMGGVTIIVPPDVDVEVDGWAVLGGIGGRDIHPAPLESQVRRVIVNAHVVMGGVEVKVRDRKPARGETVEEGDEVGERRRLKRLRGGES
jgi:hypothetical protein